MGRLRYSKILLKMSTECIAPQSSASSFYMTPKVDYWNEVHYRALRKGARRKKLRPKVVTTLFAIVVSRRTRARVSLLVALSLSLIESKPVMFVSSFYFALN